MTDARLIAIRQKLEMLGRLRGWEIPDPAPEDALAAYEAEHGVTLPAEYRAFLGQVANGGPGPDYGLNALGAVPMPTEGFVRVTSTITTKDGQQLSAGTGERPSFERPPAMDRPFAIEAEWCPVDRAGAPQAPPVSGDEHPYDGTLFLVDKGCGYFDFLVVTGPRAGQVWTDFTAGDGSIFPVDAGGFLDWYEAWLDEAVVGWLLASLNEDEARDRAIEEAPPYLPLVDRLTDARPEDPNAWLDRMRVHLAVGDRETVERLLPTAMALPRSLFVLEPIVRELHEAAFARADAQPRAGVDDDLREHPLAQVRVALAANPETDPALLLALVADDEHEVRSALARNPSADVETLDALFERARAEQAAGSLDATIHLELVAAHPGASASLIARAAALPVPADTPTHEITTVLRTAAMSPAADEATLRALAAHPAPWVRHGVAINRITPASIVALLVDDPHPRVRADLGASPAADEALLRRYAASDDAAQRAAVARNPNMPLDVLLELVGIVDEPPAHGLACNPRRPPELVALLDHHHYDASNMPAPDGSPGGWGRLPFDATALEAMSSGTSGHPSFPVRLLDGVIRSGANMAGYDAASNPWLGEAQLAVIAEDPYAYARQKVLHHPACTPKLLSKLAADPQPLVLGAVAAHPFRTLDEIAADAKHPAREVRQGVAQNPSTPVDVLVALSADEDAAVRRSVAMHARTPVAVLEALAGDEASYVRSCVAVHPATPSAVVDRLAEDTAEDVAKAVGWRRRYEAATGHPPRLVRTRP